MVIIHERDGRVIVSHVSASAMRPAVTHEEITNLDDILAALEAEETPPAEIVSTIVDTPAETEQEFEARMVAALVDPGARHIVVADPATLPKLPPERWIVNWTTGAIAIGGASKDDLIAYTADKRWRVETGGIVVGGAPIKTDRETAAMLTAANVKAKENPAYSIANWKVAPGVFVTLDAATIIAIADAVEAHVQACFDKEAELSGKILATPPLVTTTDQIDAAGWPPNAT